jgi:hypothetical protein
VKKTKSKKTGRRPGVDRKLQEQSVSREDHLNAAAYGNYDPKAAEAAQAFGFLATVRKRIKARCAFPNTWLVKAGLPPLPDAGVTYCDERLPELPVAMAYAKRSIHALLDAIERRDAKFFSEIARRIENLGANDDIWDTPASKVRFAIMSYELEHGAKPANLSVATLSEIVKAAYPTEVCDERTIRRVAKEFGYTLRGRGRPKNSNGVVVTPKADNPLLRGFKSALNPAHKL